MTENELSYIIRGAIFDVHTALGPGIFESAYEQALAHRLRKEGLLVDTQMVLPLIYDGITIGPGYRLDMMVEDMIIVEVKSVESLTDLHHKQLLTYLRLSGKKLGLLVNFNTVLVKNSIVRIVNGLEE